MELRSTPGKVEIRADGDKNTLTGYAARFYDPSDAGTEFQLYPDVVERIHPGAFERAIREDDVIGLFNHDSSIVLGRTTSGTMTLSADSRGLKYVIQLPDTRAADDVRTVIERGDVNGSSFAFLPTDGGVEWSQETRDGVQISVRNIHAVQLFDAGPVTSPAYGATTVDARSSGHTLDQKDALLREREAYFSQQQRSVKRRRYRLANATTD
jgi:HK97 family phage prohead protease